MEYKVSAWVLSHNPMRSFAGKCNRSWQYYGWWLFKFIRSHISTTFFSRNDMQEILVTLIQIFVNRKEHRIEFKPTVRINTEGKAINLQSKVKVIFSPRVACVFHKLELPPRFPSPFCYSYKTVQILSGDRFQSSILRMRIFTHHKKMLHFLLKFSWLLKTDFIF